MSNMVLVSVFDHAVGEYAPCMCVNSEAAAIRIFTDRKSTRLNSSHITRSRMPSSA